jgi:hypothetical protein
VPALGGPPCQAMPTCPCFDKSKRHLQLTVQARSSFSSRKCLTSNAGAALCAADEATLDQLSNMIALCSGPMACGGKVHTDLA